MDIGIRRRRYPRQFSGWFLVYLTLFVAADMLHDAVQDDPETTVTAKIALCAERTIKTAWQKHPSAKPC